MFSFLKYVADFCWQIYSSLFWEKEFINFLGERFAKQ